MNVKTDISIGNNMIVVAYFISMRCGLGNNTIARFEKRIGPRSIDKDETALAVLALVGGVVHRLKRGDFVN